MIRILVLSQLAALWLCLAGKAEQFTVATYNLENYTDVVGGSRPTKSEASRAKVRASIRAMHADVLAMQELGTTNAMQELRSALKKDGLDYPHWEFVPGADT